MESSILQAPEGDRALRPQCFMCLETQVDRVQTRVAAVLLYTQQLVTSVQM